MGPQTGSKSVVIAVRADDVRRSVEDDRRARGVEESFDFTLDGSRGEPLGENLPGLRADVLSKGTSGPAGPTEPQRFYALSLALIVALTSLGGYLLSRDTRRESRIAELRSQFVSSVSHELKTPLTAIRIFAETLQIKGLATNPQRHAEYLETIVNETERLTRLLNNVLDFSRIERGQKSYHIQNGSLADAVQAAARAMRFPLTEQGFDFQMELADGLPSMPIDADAIEQAVLNLLSNAMKYSGNSRHIALRLSRENGSARIDVTDRGVGIAPEEQKRIFDKFYRVPTPANRAISGTGLGLALVAHIAEAHNGRVEVESKPGEGSTFSIWLPIEDAGAAAPANVALTVGGANGAKSA
jgi:signal transduction histidine kinase